MKDVGNGETATKLVLPPNSRMYHLLQAGLNGYWCDEAKAFFRESLRQFKDGEEMDLNKMNPLEAHFIQCIDNCVAGYCWKDDEISILEAFYYIFSIPEYTRHVLFNEFQLGIDWTIFTIHMASYKIVGEKKTLLDSLRENPQMREWGRFRLYHLPETLKHFDSVYHSFESIQPRLSGIRSVLIHENLQQMQESYTRWANLVANGNPSHKDILETIKVYERNPPMPKKAPLTKGLADCLMDLIPYKAELSATGAKIAVFHEERKIPIYGKTGRWVAWIIVGILLLAAFYGMTHNMSFLNLGLLPASAIFSGLILSPTINDKNTPIPTKFFSFCERLSASHENLNALSLILAREDYAVRLDSFIKDPAPLVEKAQRFPKAFADVFEEAGNSPDVYQNILAMGKARQEGLKFLNELEERQRAETEDCVIACLKAEIQESQDLQRLAKIRDSLEQTLLAAMQGQSVQLSLTLAENGLK